MVDERNSLTLKGIAKAGDLGKSDAIDVLAARINTLNANGPPRDSAKDSKAAALDQALKSESWALPVMPERKTCGWSLSMLDQMDHVSLLLHTCLCL